MTTYALIGHPLSHSFSKGYFTKKFAEAGLSDSLQYLNFDLAQLDQLKKKLNEYSDLRGCNVTIPYKRAIIPYLDRLDPVAERIGAVNTILFDRGRRIGFNTDYIGFRDDLLEQLDRQRHALLQHAPRALILGTGGASRAVAVALKDMNIPFQYVSRQGEPDQLTYSDLTQKILEEYTLLINTTPLGMYPNTTTAPALPYKLLGTRHFCYDLVYNPAETTFLQRAAAAGAGTANGLGMLHKQAEASWAIWNRE